MAPFTIEDTALVLIDYQVGIRNWIGSIDPNEDLFLGSSSSRVEAEWEESHVD